MRSQYRRSLSSALVALTLGAVTLVGAPPGAAATPDGTSGPVIYDGGTWYIRTTPTSGPANLKFSFGRFNNVRDLPVVGDWNGDGSETVGIARIGPPGDFPGTFTWHLRNSNSSGPADISFEFGVPALTDTLRGHPIVGNFDPSDDAYEVGYVIAGDTGQLVWTIRLNTTPNSPEVTFTYGRAETDAPIVGDWDGDGVDTAGVLRGNQWLLTNAQRQGGSAQTVFAYGTTNPAIPEFAVSGDWNGDGADTPGLLRNSPPTERSGGYENWLITNENATGAADATFRYGSDAFPIETEEQGSLLFLPRLTIEVT
ncbi:hypothetical protein [Cryptosporangium minutisporangium]|uniref:VCBS repeat-containing protein n=1 Tax=Cryptosporangium minutisporangium TaxID=113569 RepID=A0ABP6T6A0_9ACTN